MKLFNLTSYDVRLRAAAYIMDDALTGYEVRITQPKRNLEQNARMWVLLTALSEQVVWHGQKLTPAEWKDMCTAALKRQKVVPGIDGGFCVLGSSTSSMSRGEMAELQDFIEAFGAQQGVDFHERPIAA
jgi:hypothetical protein